MKRLLTLLSAAVVVAGGLTLPAEAALTRVGPNATFSNGTAAGFTFPAWYQDSDGLRLDLCALMTDPFCNPVGLPAANTFPDELFWWSAESSIADAASGVDGLLVCAMEAAFGSADGSAVLGTEIAFARIRIRVDVPTIGTWTVDHPFGTLTVNVPALLPAGAPEINVTQDLGDLNVTGPASNFALALRDGTVPLVNADGRSIGPFLRPSATPGGAPLAPVTGQTPGALFIANPNFLQPITGSPVGQNFFRITGPGVALTENNFAVLGLVSGTQPALIEKAEFRVKTGKLNLRGTVAPNAAVTVTLGGTTIATATADATGVWTFHGKPAAAVTPGAAAARQVTGTSGVDTLTIPLELR